MPNEKPGWTGPGITAALLVIVLAITLVLLLGASLIHRLIGDTGASVISRVMGIVLATIALDVFDVAPPPEGSPLGEAEQ